MQYPRPEHRPGEVHTLQKGTLAMATTRTPRKAATAVTTPTAPKIDYSALKPEPVDMDPITRAREGSADFGPFVEWLNESFRKFKAGEKPAGFALSIPHASVGATKSLVNRACASIKDENGKRKMGVSVQIGPKNADGNVTFKFCAKDPAKIDETKPRRPVRKDAWTDAEYITATETWIDAITAYLTEKGETAKVELATAKAKADVKALRDAAKAARAAEKAAQPPVKAVPTPVKRAG